MVSRADEAAFPGRLARPGAAASARTRLSAGQRLLFVFSLVAFGMAASYSSVALLSRIWPALFPGHNLSDVRIPVVSQIVSAPIIPDAIKPSQPGDDSKFNQRKNLLIIGVDKRPFARDEDAYNTDTLMVATIDPVSKQASILSFPRDMWIDIHPPDGGQYKDRINASYAAGYLRGRSFEAGAQQLAKDIKLNFGIDVDQWVWLDFKGVEKLIDALGGIDIDVPYDLQVPHYGGSWYYSDDDIHARYISIPPGRHHLDGYLAVAFGRYRNDSDLARVKRQQLVLTTAAAQVFDQSLLDDPLGLYDAYAKTVHTDIPKGLMPGYALLLKETNGRMQTFSLGDKVNGRDTLFGFTTDGGAAVLGWDPANVQTIISQAFTKAKYSASTVEIQNATGDVEATRAFALGRYLKFSKGLPTVEVGHDEPVQAGTHIILYVENRRPVAEDIAKWLNVPPSSIRTAPKDSDTQPDVVIVIGKDFKVPGS